MRRVLAALFSLAAVASPRARAEVPSATASASASPGAAQPAAAAAPVSVEPPAKLPPPAPDPTLPPPSPAPAAPTARVKKRRKKPPAPPPPAAELIALNTHETYLLRPDSHGHFTRAQLHGWNHFLRCHHTGRVHSMSTRLAQLIYEVDQHFDFKKVIVVAGYRAPRIAREKGNPKSPHKKGVACDFRIEGVPNTDLRDFERTLPHVGVGYYPNSEFVHLDCDPLRNRRSAFWIDYSRPGERARYSRNPEADLEEEDQQQVVEGAPSTAPSDLLFPGFGGDEPQAPLREGAPAPNSPPPIFTLPQNY
jgi:uncharacterized protein YcbK (DUF882 family)